MLVSCRALVAIAIEALGVRVAAILRSRPHGAWPARSARKKKIGAATEFAREMALQRLL